jgi:hypothetical protein
VHKILYGGQLHQSWFATFFVTWLTAQNDRNSPRTVRRDQFMDDVSDKYTTQWEN